MTFIENDLSINKNVLVTGVSNTELRLTVELKALSGILVLNIPPPPNDRVWVGFRPVPKLILTACPVVGERNVSYTMVTSWIEKKIVQEFEVSNLFRPLAV